MGPRNVRQPESCVRIESTQSDEGWRAFLGILPIVDHFVRTAGRASAVMSSYLTMCERSESAYPADVFAEQIWL